MRTARRVGHLSSQQDDRLRPLPWLRPPRARAYHPRLSASSGGRTQSLPAADVDGKLDSGRHHRGQTVKLDPALFSYYLLACGHQRGSFFPRFEGEKLPCSKCESEQPVIRQLPRT